MSRTRRLSPLDRLLDEAQRGISGMADDAIALRKSPGAPQPDVEMPERQRVHAAGLMRINHTGEVCAQALYVGQAAVARDEATRAQLLGAAQEETDHLAWCADRLRELDSRPSLFNPLWYAGSYAIGVIAGLRGDGWNLGFVVETERQVEEHLASHLSRLPERDTISRAIVAQMKDDEAQHGRAAQQAGAAPLPLPLRLAMRLAAKVMTTVAHRI